MDHTTIWTFFLILFLHFSSIRPDNEDANNIIPSRQVPYPDPERTECGGGFIAIDWNRSHLWQIPPGSAAASPQQPSNYFPLHIHFVFIPPWNREDEIAMRTATRAVNDRLGKIIRTEPRIDLRYPRGKKQYGQGCDLPESCGRIVVPPEYLHVCYDSNSNIIPEPGVPDQMSPTLQQVAMDNSNLLIFLRRAYPSSPYSGCGKYTIASAFTCALDYNTMRPTHGEITFCSSPADLKYRLEDTLLHEIIHVLTGGSFMGYQSDKHIKLPLNQKFDRTARKRAAEGNTWTKAYFKWLDPHGSSAPIYNHVVKTPAVLDAVRRYFRCDNLEGAEVSVRTPLDSYYDIFHEDGHWSQRLFPDEIMTPITAEILVLSSLTLAMLQDSGWYEVNMSYAEPMNYNVSRYPHIKGEYCHIAKKSCYEILHNATTEFDSTLTQELPWVGPFCKTEGTALFKHYLPTRACTMDGRARLTCDRSVKQYSMKCDVYRALPMKDGYEVDCFKQRLPPKWERFYDLFPSTGSVQFVKNATCITYEKYWTGLVSAIYNHPVCLFFECMKSSAGLMFHIYNRDGTKCDSPVTCRKPPATNDTKGPCYSADQFSKLNNDYFYKKYNRTRTLGGLECKPWSAVNPFLPTATYPWRDNNVCWNFANNRRGPWCIIEINPNMKKQDCFYLCEDSAVQQTWPDRNCYHARQSGSQKIMCPDYKLVCETPGGAGYHTYPPESKSEDTDNSGSRVDPAYFLLHILILPVAFLQL